jgi:hypothetical protein
MGDAKTAREVYARAIDDGVENPNARPRAEDLVATCCSLALQGVEPDAATWSRLRKIHEELREPW